MSRFGPSAPVMPDAQFTQARRQPVWHLDHLTDPIERVVITGEPPYPLERTLLTTGVIGAVMTSRFEGGRRVEAPHLDVTYPSQHPEHLHHLVAQVVDHLHRDAPGSRPVERA